MSCHEEQALLWVQKSCFSPRYPKHCSVELINVVQKRCKPGYDSRRWQLYLNFDLCSSHRAKTETPDIEIRNAANIAAGVLCSGSIP